MLDLTFVRNNCELVKKNNAIRNCSISVDEIIVLDQQRRESREELDSMRAKRNTASHRGKPSEEHIAQMKKLKEDIKQKESDVGEIEKKLNGLLIQLPNMTHESVPVGKDNTGNVVHKKWSPVEVGNSDVPKFDFEPKPHWELGKALHIIDEETGAKVAGSRFWYLKNELVYLEFAIIQYALTFLKEQGFSPMIPPMIVRERALYGTGFFPADENEVYRLANPDLNVGEGKNDEGNDGIPSWDTKNQFLIGTAEVPLAAYHADSVIDVSKPVQYCGFSSCFRREAGTYGKDMKGILRGHQFDKIEMFVFCKKEDSWMMHERLTELAESFWKSLKIPYRVMLMCSGDIGPPNAKKYDIEAWLPGECTYREVVSASNDTDFQARRLNIKYQTDDGKRAFVHTLNSTLTAVGRTMIAIIENYQTKEGRVIVPEVLKPYMFGIEMI